MPPLTDCLETDHRRLDAILTDCKRLADSHLFVAAAEKFTLFAQGLSRHIDAEERVLFPALEERVPQAAGPTRVMRFEHARLRELLVRLAQALAASDRVWQPATRELEELLAAHNTKEERVLYPMANSIALGVANPGELRAKLTDALG
jgi:hemerythrin-like domain-containing protein